MDSALRLCLIPKTFYFLVLRLKDLSYDLQTNYIISFYLSLYLMLSYIVKFDAT